MDGAAVVTAVAASSANSGGNSNSNSHLMPSPSVSMMEMTNLTRTTLPNIKVTRFKGKRAYPSVPNQPSEASAHFMFELAKTVLTKAGGTSTTSLFTQPTANQNPRGPQRALHMCAFQIGLYALGLHNRVSPNWISRTYSSHVSWITGQAMEIGATAISFLIGTWEGHLTPPEAANIADRASRGRDAGIVTAAAELALSCLSHAHALNPSEIARAILQCKEQSDVMLEKACLAVEEAARGGGVYPEVMFTVAKYWYELFKAHSPPGNRSDEVMHHRPGAAAGGGLLEAAGLAAAHHQPPPPVVTLAQPPQQQAVTISHQIPLGASAAASAHHHHPSLHPHMQLGMQFPIYSLIQAGFPAAPSLPPQIPLHMQMYLGPPQHHHHAAAAAAMLSAAGLSVPTSLTGGGHHQPAAAGFPFPALAGAGGLAGLPGSLQLFPNVSEAGANGGPRFNLTAGGGSLLHVALPGVSLPLLPTPPQPAPAPNGQPHHLQQGMPPPPLLPHPAPSGSPLQAPPPVGPPNNSHHHHHHHHAAASAGVVGNVLYQRYLLSAFRVGMLALETLGRRVSEDRPQTKFTRNPSYAEDVKWLLGVAKKVGLPYLQNFLMCVMVTVVSPFVLQVSKYNLVRLNF
jgi:hypothetical protein